MVTKLTREQDSKIKCLKWQLHFQKKKRKCLFLAMTLVLFIKSHFTNTLYTISFYHWHSSSISYFTFCIVFCLTLTSILFPPVCPILLNKFRESLIVLMWHEHLVFFNYVGGLNLCKGIWKLWNWLTNIEIQPSLFFSLFI